TRPPEVDLGNAELDRLEIVWDNAQDINCITVLCLIRVDDIKDCSAEAVMGREQILLDIGHGVAPALMQHRQGRMTLGECLNVELIRVLVLDHLGKSLDVSLIATKDRDGVSANRFDILHTNVLVLQINTLQQSLSSFR